MFSTSRWQAGSPEIFLFILLLLSCGVLLPAKSSPASEIMLPKVYNRQIEVSGWLMSEKLDGVRGYWDGHNLLSRNGNLFYPPAEFTRNLPPFPLEGELWAGREHFEQTVSIVCKKEPHAGWQQIRFAIFDVPEAPGGFTERIARARSWLAEHPSDYAFIIPQIIVEDQAHLLDQLKKIEMIGGEGLIIRKPDALYTAGRSMEILKLKSHQDAEATVLAHIPGTGRNRGRMGSLLVSLEDGTQFRIGSGFSDMDREQPPPIGAIITFKYFDKYQSGIPKFPSFVRLRLDHQL